jgi:2-polyprenyl-6-methoxyphenol hydroxylase-like FAD-dependent oxidoreductase
MNDDEIAEEAPKITTNVIINGCGPVGALLANLFGIYGIKTIILEKESQVHAFHCMIY